MGAHNSVQDFSSNSLLTKFVSEEHILADDIFWNSFLEFVPKPTTLEEDKLLFEKLQKTVNTLYVNNLKSGNVRSLIRVFLSKASELLVSSVSNDNSYECSSLAHNALYITRCCINLFLHNYSEKDVIGQIEAQGIAACNKPEVTDPILYLFIDSLFDIIINVPVKNNTYLLHIESINMLIVLLSVQLFTTENTSELMIYKCIFENKKAQEMCKTLLDRFVQQPKYAMSGGGSIIFDLAADIIGFFMPQSDENCSPLARSSVLLCIVIVNNFNQPNVYREYLSNLSDGIDSLYKTICPRLDKEETTLILYHLLHRNPHFRAYLLIKAEIEALVIPMLQTIYHASDSSCHHIYMSLIVLLILTEDVEFNKKVHQIIIKSVPWYTDRSLPEISLGGLIILVTARTVQYNLLKMRDEYLHSNCLAALANMSSQFTNLHPYVCQRLVGLFEVLAKTYNRSKQEFLAIERALRIILEVLNSCLSNQLLHNTNLVYTLLYKRNIFDCLKNNTAFHDLINNLEQVLEYFTSKLEKTDEACNDVDSVLSIIIEASPKWPSHRLQKFPELKFKYVEEEKPEDFFVPYIWSLVNQHSNIYWDKEQFKLC